MPTKAKPVHQVRLGNIKAAIWKNESESGTQLNVTFERLFKKGDEWQSSDSPETCSSSAKWPAKRTVGSSLKQLKQRESKVLLTVWPGRKIGHPSPPPVSR